MKHYGIVCLVIVSYSALSQGEMGGGLTFTPGSKANITYNDSKPIL